MGGSPVDFIHQLVGQKQVEIGCIYGYSTQCYWQEEVFGLPEKIFIVGGIGEDSIEECVRVLTYYNSARYGNVKE